MLDVACEFACAVEMRRNNWRERLLIVACSKFTQQDVSSSSTVPGNARRVDLSIQ